jgi:hypothetical protein
MTPQLPTPEGIPSPRSTPESTPESLRALRPRRQRTRAVCNTPSRMAAGMMDTPPCSSLECEEEIEMSIPDEYLRDLTQQVINSI